MMVFVSDHIPEIVLSGFMLSALWIDIATLRIPNRIVLLVILAFVFCAPLMGLSLEEILAHVAVGVGVFVTLFAVALFGAMTSSLPLGGGDVKLGGAIGLWLGFGAPFYSFVAWLVISLAGLIALVVVLTMMRNYPVVVPTTGIVWVDDLTMGKVSIRKAKVPFGIPLCISAIAAIWLT